MSPEQLAKQIAFLFRKHRIDYDQSRYIIKLARKHAVLKAPKSKKGTVDRLSNEERDKFIAEAFKMSPAKGLMMQTLYATAARVDEFVNLKPKDLFIAQQVIIIRHGKGNKRREVPVDVGLLRSLQVHLNGRTTGYLFENRLHKAFTARRIQQLVKEVAEGAGIRINMYPHLLRHTRATDLAENGVTMEILNKLLGHDKLETTQIYTRTAQLDVRLALKSIP